MNPVLSVSHLSVILNRKPILRDISFTLQEKELLIILGNNGTGKSTLAKTLAGMYPFEGELRLFGKELEAYESKERAQKITYIPSTLHSYDESMNVESFVMLGRYPHHSRFDPIPCEEQECMLAVLHYFGIQSLAETPINALSSGEMQLTLLAQATIQDSDIWIMDEPTSSLDIQNTLLIHQEIQKLKNLKTMILITHDINLAYHLKGRIAYMKEGSIVWQGNSEAFFREENLQELYQAKLIMNAQGITPDYA